MGFHSDLSAWPWGQQVGHSASASSIRHRSFYQWASTTWRTASVVGHSAPEISVVRPQSRLFGIVPLDGTSPNVASTVRHPPITISINKGPRYPTARLGRPSITKCLEDEKARSALPSASSPQQEVTVRFSSASSAPKRQSRSICFSWGESVSLIHSSFIVRPPVLNCQLAIRPQLPAFDIDRSTSGPQPLGVPPQLSVIRPPKSRSFDLRAGYSGSCPLMGLGLQRHLPFGHTNQIFGRSAPGSTIWPQRRSAIWPRIHSAIRPPMYSFRPFGLTRIRSLSLYCSAFCGLKHSDTRPSSLTGARSFDHIGTRPSGLVRPTFMASSVQAFNHSAKQISSTRMFFKNSWATDSH
ncbi:hypothetical protein LR48_Vigan03g196100 [Vigna angularis]|uniref:Uncharacterized protein n=1 Tax=Phaseolus angularis TaxID=3914 RepID=A0A0L9U801_PHAAN|nr:hypothetical protein LR48_Vigan03g196100 [Vigna angularis]